MAPSNLPHPHTKKKKNTKPLFLVLFILLKHQKGSLLRAQLGEKMSCLEFTLSAKGLTLESVT